MRKKVAWITGASSGIGAKLAEVYAHQGWDLIITSRNESSLKNVALSCEKYSCRVTCLSADLSQSDTPNKIVPQAISIYGNIDAIVHSAGVSQRSLAFETQNEVDRMIMELNYFSIINITKLLLPHFQENKGGDIVILSSLSGLMGYPLRSAYSASKFALHGFFETLQTEKKPEGLNILLVCPGRVKTPISIHALQGNGSAHGKMDKGQMEGLDAEKVANKIFKASQSKKNRIILAKEEWILLILHRLCRPLYFWLAHKSGMK